MSTETTIEINGVRRTMSSILDQWRSIASEPGCWCAEDEPDVVEYVCEVAHGVDLYRSTDGCAWYAVGNLHGLCAVRIA